MMGDDDSVFAALRAGARGYLLKGAAPADVERAAGTTPASPGRRSLSPKKVRNNMPAILAKLQVADLAQLIVRAREAGLGDDA